MTDTAVGTLGAAVDELLRRRVEANERFFETEADRVARLCLAMAERFTRGGRLLAVGASPQGRSDAHHVAVEFVHPVIVGKRALPALALDQRGLDLLAEADDMVIAFDEARLPDKCLSITFRQVGAEWEFDPPDDDPFVRQELTETLYHVLWELVHVFFDHLGSSAAGAGASSFLYPFLEEQRADLEAVVADFHAAPQGWPSRRALNLAEDAAILTALANDIGPEVLFARQLIAYGRAGDVALALSTSGSSSNIVEGLAEARRRGLRTVAFVGYDGGRVAAERLADHVIVSRSEHIPRIQEAQASGYHVLRQLVESAGGG